MKNNKLFIFGHSGFIGSSLCKQLKKYDYNFSFSKKFLKKNNNQLNDKDLKKIVINYDTLIYLSSVTDIKYTEDNIYKSIKISFLPIIKIIDIANKLNKKIKIIFTSSVTVFGNNKSNIKFNETSEINPITIYDVHKKLIEDQLIYANKSKIIDLVILRLSNVYGNSVNESVNKNRNIIKKIVNNAIKYKTINLFAGGNFYRDFIHIDDVISALRKSIILKNNNKTIFHICYGKSYTLKYVYTIVKKIIKDKFNINVKIKSSPFPEDINIINKRNFRINNSTSKKVLKWYPEVTLKKGLERLI